MEIDQQAIYAEIEKEPPDKKVLEYFKSLPYHLRKSKDMKPMENGKYKKSMKNERL